MIIVIRKLAEFFSVKLSYQVYHVLNLVNFFSFKSRQWGAKVLNYIITCIIICKILFIWGVWLTSKKITSNKINADKFTDTMFNTKNF